MRRVQVNGSSNKPGAGCKKRLIKVMKVHGGWKLNLLPPSEVLVYGGRSWPAKIFNQQFKPFTEAEDDLIVKLHSLLGNRWALIAGRLPDRTEDEVKTHWNSKLEAKLSQTGNMHTKKPNSSMNVARAIDQSPVSDAASGLEEDSSVIRGLNLDLSMSVSTSSLWDAKEKIEANSSDHSANIGTWRNTGNKTLLLFQ